MAKKFEYSGLGFPILLLDVPMRQVRGVEVPDVDYNILQQKVLLKLCRKPFPLTGNEIRFIRQFFELNYSEFANQFGVTHASVIHWEKAQDAFAKITPTTELCIRLYILDALRADDKLFRSTFRLFDYSKFQKDIKLGHQELYEELLTLDSQHLAG